MSALSQLGVNVDPDTPHAVLDRQSTPSDGVRAERPPWPRRRYHTPAPRGGERPSDVQDEGEQGVAVVGSPVGLRFSVSFSSRGSSVRALSVDPLGRQTQGKTYPYLFSQCQPIYARALVPIQGAHIPSPLA